MGVLRPLKVVLTNLKEGETIELDAPNHPQKPEMGTRKIPLTREIYIEQEDFMEDAPKKFFRLKPEGEVRLRSAGIIKCDEVVKNAAGNVTELRCTFDPDHSAQSEGQSTGFRRPLALTAEVRSTTTLRRRESRQRPRGEDVPRQPQPELVGSRQPRQARTIAERRQAGNKFPVRAFRLLFVDPVDSKPGKPVFNRTSTLRDELDQKKLVKNRIRAGKPLPIVRTIDQVRERCELPVVSRRTRGVFRTTRPVSPTRTAANLALPRRVLGSRISTHPVSQARQQSFHAAAAGMQSNGMPSPWPTAIPPLSQRPHRRGAPPVVERRQAPQPLTLNNRRPVAAPLSRAARRT